MTERVAVYIDYENMHRGGHGLYAGVGEPRYETVVNPLRIAKRIVAQRSKRRESILSAVHVYRGRPLPQFQPEAASANDTLAAAWEADGVHVVRRDLKYVVDDYGNWRAEEKGIDVAMAIGIVDGAIKEQFDVAVAFSNDTDQLPALELAFNDTKPGLEIACWTGAKPLWFPEKLRDNIKLPYCHFVSESDFVSCRDYRAATQ